MKALVKRKDNFQSEWGACSVFIQFTHNKTSCQGKEHFCHVECSGKEGVQLLPFDTRT